MHSLEVVEVALVQCRLVNNHCQQNSQALYIFTPNKSYCYLLNVETNNLVFLKTYNTKFNDFTITFTDQNGRQIEIQGKVNLTLFIKK